MRTSRQAPTANTAVVLESTSSRSPSKLRTMPLKASNDFVSIVSGMEDTPKVAPTAAELEDRRAKGSGEASGGDTDMGLARAMTR